MNDESNIEPQGIPAKVYRTDERVMVAAPMPGLEPDNITVQVESGPSLTLHGALRGTLKDDKEVLLDEWTPGPYHRELALPAEVDGERANMTYNNGVLVVVLPVAEHTRTAQLTLDTVSPTQGERVGHTGHDNRPVDGSVVRESARAAERETPFASGDEL